MKVTEDDRYIFDRYEIGFNMIWQWMWDCPEDACGDYADFLDSRQEAIDSARRHDEERHR